MPIAGWADTDVNTCGQVVLGNAFLSGDLDCSGFSGTAVTIKRGTLDLRGFTLTAAVAAVECKVFCTVLSDSPGGTITSDGSATIVAIGRASGAPRTNLGASSIVINDGRIGTFKGDVKVVDSTITGMVNSSRSAAVSGETVRLIRASVTGNVWTGVIGRKVKIVDSDVSDNGGLGVLAIWSTNIKRSTIVGNASVGVANNFRSLRVTDSVIAGNGDAGIKMTLVEARGKIVRSDISANAAEGVQAGSGRLLVRDSTINNNGAQGIFLSITGDIKLTNSTVTGNALDGIASTASFVSDRCSIKLRRSTVMGNAFDASCGVSRTCADLTSCGLPKVSSSSTCETSYDSDSGFPGTNWGVCTLD